MTVRADLAVAVFGAFIGTATLVLLPSQVDPEGLAAIADPYSAAFFPILIAAFLIVCSAVLVADALARRTPSASEEPEIEAPLRLTATAACILAYTLLIYWIGMVPASMLSIVALALILGFKRLLVLLPLAVLIPLGIYYVFERLLHVLLPAGRLFS